jgi:hypothetical protein
LLDLLCQAMTSSMRLTSEAPYGGCSIDRSYQRRRKPSLIVCRL